MMVVTIPTWPIVLAVRLCLAMAGADLPVLARPLMVAVWLWRSGRGAIPWLAGAALVLAWRFLQNRGRCWRPTVSGVMIAGSEGPRISAKHIAAAFHSWVWRDCATTGGGPC
jgi:hypothetical protein